MEPFPLPVSCFQICLCGLNMPIMIWTSHQIIQFFDNFLFFTVYFDVPPPGYLQLTHVFLDLPLDRHASWGDCKPAFCMLLYWAAELLPLHLASQVHKETAPTILAASMQEMIPRTGWRRLATWATPHSHASRGFPERMFVRSGVCRGAPNACTQIQASSTVCSH